MPWQPAVPMQSCLQSSRIRKRRDGGGGDQEEGQEARSRGPGGESGLDGARAGQRVVTSEKKRLQGEQRESERERVQNSTIQSRQSEQPR